MLWKWELADSETNYEILVVFEPTTPKQIPTRYLFSFYKSIWDLWRASWAAHKTKPFCRLTAC